MSVTLIAHMDFPAAAFDGPTGDLVQMNTAWLRSPELIVLSGNSHEGGAEFDGARSGLPFGAMAPHFRTQIREAAKQGSSTVSVLIASNGELIKQQIKLVASFRALDSEQRSTVLGWISHTTLPTRDGDSADMTAALARYGSLINEPWAYVDAAGVFRYVSPQSLALLGPDAIGGLLGVHFMAWAAGRADRSVGMENIERALAGESLAYDRLRFDYRFGAQRWHRVEMRPDIDVNHKQLGVFIVSHDIHAHRSAEAEARSVKNLLDLHMQYGPMIAIELDSDFRILSWSQRAEELFGYSAAEAVGSTMRELNTVCEVGTLEEQLGALLTGQISKSLRHRNANRTKKGDIVWVDWVNSVVNDPATGRTTLLSLGTDATQEIGLKERLSAAVMHDALTGGLNRKTLAHVVTSKLSQRANFALMTLDLDSFKQINDYRGHHTGDHLLVELANRMRSLLAPSERMARLGGDEFALLLDLAGYDSDEAILERANVILKCLAAPVIVDFEFAVTASAGIAKASDSVVDAETLFMQADMAMYRAKEAGRNRAVIYVPNIGTAVRTRLEMCESLRQAVRQQRIDVCYQPIFDTASDRIVGAEALARWGGDGDTAVEPSVFVGLAEEKGFIHELWQCVMRKACMFAASINRIGGSNVACPISVNVSPIQLGDPRFDRYVLQILKDTRCLPTWIALEVTESASLGEFSSSATLRRLTAMGVACSVDDFGTGYSNFGHLRRLSLAALKIDKSFVRDLARGDVSIVSAIVPMAHSLGLKVVAEGVEFVEELIALKAIGCDRYQGFVASAPIRGDEFALMLEHDRAAHAQFAVA